MDHSPTALAGSARVRLEFAARAYFTMASLLQHLPLHASACAAFMSTKPETHVSIRKVANHLC